MARIIRLTERDLTRLVKRVINEESNRYFKIGDMIKLKVGTNNTNTIVAKITNSE